MVLINTPEDAELARDLATLVGPEAIPMAFGGAYDGAARFDKQLALWNPPLQSADADILPEKEILDARARDSARNDAYVQGGKTLHKDSIVGHMYVLNSKPAWEVLSDGDEKSMFNEDWAEAFQQEVEMKFQLWAESRFKWVDAAQKNDFTAMVRLGVGVYAAGGELLATAEWRRNAGREYNTAIQMVDCDRLSTPYEYEWDENVRGGIKHDSFGAPVSYFIRYTHPHDFRNTTALTNTMRWKEVPRYRPWGREMVIHIMEQDRVDQTRAVADMVSALKEINITRKFRDVTLQNAVVNAMYAASIESELPPSAVFEQMGAGNTGGAVADYAEAFLGAVNEYVGSSKHMKIDGVKIPHLFPGTKLNLHPAGNPGGVGQDFEQSLLRYIAAALNVSYEELSKDYTKTNYSSARAAMAGTWRFMQARKKMVADAFANSIFRLWLEEAIQKDRLKTFPAKMADMLYTNKHLNTMFEALCQADWIGAARGQIDELKETQAAVLRIKYGLSTHEDELARLGKDWRKVYAQLQREQKERDKRDITLLEDNSVNAASGSPRDAAANDSNSGNADNGN